MTRLRPWAFLLLAAALCASACNRTPPAEDADTTDPDAVETEDAAEGTLAILDGQPIMADQIFVVPELRRSLINVRNQMIDMELTRAEFAKLGLKVDEDVLKREKEQFYRQMLMSMQVTPPEDDTLEQVFTDSFLKERNMTMERFNQLYTSQHMAGMLVVKEHPVTDTALKALYNDATKFPKDEVVQAFGTQYGWTAATDITYEAAKPLLTNILTQEAVSKHQAEVSTKLGDDARAAGRLDVRRLPNETLPESVSPAVDGVAARAPGAGESYKPEPIAFTLDDKDYTWDEVLAGFPDQNFVDQLYFIPVQNAVVNALWADTKEELSDAEVAGEVAKLKVVAGDEYAINLANDNTTEAELHQTLGQFLRLRKLISRAHPVTEAEIQSQYDQIPPEQRAAVATELKIENPESATFAEMKGPMREQLEGMKAGESRVAWLAERFHELVANGRLKIIDERVKVPEPPPAAPPQMAPPPTQELPPGVPPGGVTPPTG